MDLLADLNDAQREAVTHFDGPLLIVAGPGSGKTRVITRRVAYLTQVHNVEPKRVLAVTFTNKAAGEMRQRIFQLIPGAEEDPRRGVLIPPAPFRLLRICTFHSLGAYLLRIRGDRIGLDPKFSIYDQDDRTQLVKAAMEEAKLDDLHYPADRIQAAISRAKNDLQGPEQYTARANDFFGQTVARVFPLYEKKLREANALDFDDLLLWTARMLRDQEIRQELNDRYRYVLVDEHQDTNKPQYAIARALAFHHKNLCVVGDPDQSIYRWRGADIKNILDFERDFPGVRLIKLEKNYRSTKAILRCADQLIAHNKKRKAKRLITDNAEGQAVTVLTFDTGLQEAHAIAERIAQAVRAGGRRYRDFALFLRVNALSRALETAFIKQRVPYQMVRGLAFFERKENKDILAYLRLLLNSRDNLSFERIVNEPARGIGKTSLEHLRAYAGPRELSLLAAAADVQKIPAIRGKAAKGLAEFAHLIYELGQMAGDSADDVIRQVMDRSGYRAMLADSQNEEDQERLANIEELITAAREFAEEDADHHLGAFLEHVTLKSDVDGWDEKQDQVSIMTLHAAKGLEFPVVYMVAVEQGLLPHERSSANDEELEEERRLAFVGMTRAEEELYLSHARLREFRGNSLYAIPSQFLDELPNEGVERQKITLDEWPFQEEEDVEPRESARWERGHERAGGYRPRSAPRPAERPQPVPGADYKGLAEGSMVRHRTYGVGKVIELSGYGAMRKVKVRFSKEGVRTFVLEKAPLELVSS